MNRYLPRWKSTRPPWAAGLVLAIAGQLVTGCSIQPTHIASARDISPGQLLSGKLFFAEQPLPPLPIVDILHMDQEMREFVDRAIDRRGNKDLRMRRLLMAIIHPGSFGIEYSSATHTAAETFHTGNGNCLSFTNLFIAMARYAGLSADFQQVDIPPDWEQHGDTFILNRHINARVLAGRNIAERAVDFNIDDFKSSYDREVVSDLRAAAHYYNNIGVDKLQAGEFKEAFLYLRQGLHQDERFAPLWTNLGTLYSRAHHLDYAETGYLQALQLDPGDMVSMSNLARLYEKNGDMAQAKAYSDMVKNHREQNPYYRFSQARTAVLTGNYGGALGHLDFAIRRRPNEDAFYFLRGLVYKQLGNAAKARADLEKAEELAADDELKQKYHSKMDLLLSIQKPSAQRDAP